MNPAILQVHIRIVRKSDGSRGDKPPNPNPKYLHTCEVSEAEHPFQWTEIFEDTEGNRLHKAQDMGYRHPFWAKLKSEPVISCIAAVSLDSVHRLRIPYDFEAKLRQAVDDAQSQPEYLMVRAKDTESDSVFSEVFITDTQGLPNWTKEWNDYPLPIVGGKDLPELLRPMFDITRHPFGRGRWLASDTVMSNIRLSRFNQLVDMAWDGEPNIMCEGIPEDIDNPTRLATYIVGDVAMLGNVPRNSLHELVVLTDKLDVREKVAIIKALKPPVEIQQWRKVDSYSGMPSDGVSSEETAGNYDVTKHRLWAYGHKTKPKNLFDVDPYPVGTPDRCPPLEWLS